jgi:hypothetical protein
LAESPSQTINTAYIERSNLDWRLWDAHLTRKAPTVARSMRWLRAKIRDLRGLLQFDSSPRNTQPRRRSNISTEDPGYGGKCGGSPVDVF